MLTEFRKWSMSSSCPLSLKRWVRDDASTSQFFVKVHCPFKWSFWTHNQVESKSTFESALAMCIVETTKVAHWFPWTLRDTRIVNWLWPSNGFSSVDPRIFVMWSYHKHFPWNVMHAGYWKLRQWCAKKDSSSNHVWKHQSKWRLTPWHANIIQSESHFMIEHKV